MAQNTKAKLDKIVSQARESLKVLETLQKEAVSRAKTMINLPSGADTKRLTNEKIVSSLKKMGLATQDEVRELEKKVEDLASELRSQMSKLNRKSAKKDKEEGAEA